MILPRARRAAAPMLSSIINNTKQQLLLFSLSEKQRYEYRKPEHREEKLTTEKKTSVSA